MYKTELEAYRSDMLLSRKNGYLQLAGLFKFENEVHVFGNTNASSFNLGISELPEQIGVFKKDNDIYSFESKLKVKATSRNLRTVYKLLELSEE